MRMFERKRYCKKCGGKLLPAVFKMYYCYDCNCFLKREETIGRRFAKMLKMTGKR